MQETFLKKLVLCLIVAAGLALFVEFYKNFIEGADQALNGKHPHVQMHPTPHPHT